MTFDFNRELPTIYSPELFLDKHWYASAFYPVEWKISPREADLLTYALLGLSVRELGKYHDLCDHSLVVSKNYLEKKLALKIKQWYDYTWSETAIQALVAMLNTALEENKPLKGYLIPFSEEVAQQVLAQHGGD